MVSPEVNNFTQTSAAYETTTSAPMTRTSTEAGDFNFEDNSENTSPSPEGRLSARKLYEKRIAENPSGELDDISKRYDSEDSSLNYKEEKPRFLKKRKAQKEYEQSWQGVIDSENEDIDPTFNTDPIDEIVADVEKLNSGELYPSKKVLRNLGKRALALEEKVDIDLPLAPVENAMLRVVAVDPDFKDKAEAAIDRIYANRPETPPEMQKIAHDTVQKVAQVAENPDDFIAPEHIEGSAPAVEHILEEASNLVTARRINHAVQEKEWAKEDAEDEAREKEKVSA